MAILLLQTYACMVTHIARVWINPGKIANPARGQLNRKNISLSAFAPENLVSRDGFGSPSRPEFRGGVHLYI